MNNMGEQINVVVNNLAEKLGVAAEKLYPILIKQAYIDGILNLIYTLISIILLFVCYKSVYICYFKLDKEGDRLSYRWEFTHFGFWFIWVLVFVFALFSLIFSIDNCVTAFVNPDWYALKIILDKLK